MELANYFASGVCVASLQVKERLLRHHGVGEWAAVLGELTQTLRACLHQFSHLDPLVLLNLLGGNPLCFRNPTGKPLTFNNFCKLSRGRACTGAYAHVSNKGASAGLCRTSAEPSHDTTLDWHEKGPSTKLQGCCGRTRHQGSETV